MAVYRDSASKMEDNKSSASALLTVGGIGLVLVVLVFFDVLPIHFAGTNRYLLCGVMGTLFLIFVIVGIYSVLNTKKYSEEAKAEEDLKNDVDRWCKEHLTAEKIDAQLDLTDCSMEQKYFERSEYMKQMISEAFPFAKEDFIEHFVDLYYQSVFGE